MHRRRLLLLANTSFYLYNFRTPLLLQLRDSGYEVLLAAPADACTGKLRDLGFTCLELERVDRKGVNPWRDLRLLGELRSLIARTGPDLVLNFTIKPNIYGSLAARLAGVPSICTVTGLGTAFAGTGPLSWLVTQLFRFAMTFTDAVVFQNVDDRAVFLSRGVIDAGRAVLSPGGSGVDLEHFSCAPLPEGGMRFLMLSRLLKDKGVLEFVEAATLVRREFPEAGFDILGSVDPGNPNSIEADTVEGWRRSGTVTCHGFVEDVRPHIAASSVVVLPSSYREGVPHCLLEGMAMGRPLITTDSVGCRETVQEGVNGFLVQPRDPAGLAAAMLRLLGMTPPEREAMGLAGRDLARCRFDVRKVNDLYLELLQVSLGRASGLPQGR